MNAPLYTTEILRLAAAVPESAILEREDGRAELRSPTCGSTVAVAIQTNGDLIEAVSLTVQACAFGQASSALMARHAAGRSRAQVEETVLALEAWLQGEREDAGQWPELSALTPARSRTSRHGAILLPFRALLAAITEAGRG